MTPVEWWMMPGAAALLGAALGGWVGLRARQTRATSVVRNQLDDLERTHAEALEKLRVAHARAKKDLEKERSASKRQLAIVKQATREAALLAEERLQAANAEIGRLRRSTRSRTAAPAELVDGFAATLPMDTAEFSEDITATLPMLVGR